MTDSTKPHWLELIAESSPTAIVVIDRDRIIRYANKMAALMSEVPSPEDLLGQSYLNIVGRYQVIGEDGKPLAPANFPSTQTFARGVETRDQIIAQVTGQGVHYWLSISSIPIFNDAKEVDHAIIRFENVSERKKREDRLKFLVESSKTLSIAADLQTRLFEKARLFIPTLADWCTMNIVREDGTLERVAIVHRDSEKTALVEALASYAANDPNAAVQRVVRSGTSELYPRTEPETVHRISESPEVDAAWEALKPSSALIVPIKSGGKVLGVLSLAYAESNRTYTEDDKEFFEEFGLHLGVIIDNSRLYTEIERRDKGKDHFLATLSHELRNPLAPIKHSLELLKLTTTEKDALVQEELSMIEHQFDHLSKLLHDLLDITRYTQAKIRIEPKPVELDSLINGALKVQRPFLDKKGLELKVLLPDYPLWVAADELRLEQALINLIHNAEKFTPTSGCITIMADQKDGFARVAVSDTGIGIEKSDLRKIFDAYYQGDREIIQKTGGLGMGLQLVQEIVRLHGGMIEAFSEGPGKGSTFLLSLPLLEAAPHAATPAAGPTRSSSTPKTAAPKKVLIVDDNEPAANALVKLLTAIGLTAQAAYSGSETLQAFEDFDPEVMIVDIGLPDMTGYELIATLRAKEKPFFGIALSGYGQEEDKQKARDAGFDHHLTKPVGLAELREVLGA